MELTRCYHKDSSMVARKIANEVILVPIRQNVGDLQYIYTLNEVGARIWELLGGEVTVADIVSALCNEYEVDRAQVEADIVDFLVQLESIGAIAPDELREKV
ncbi:PqqD family protein [Chloroflexota bacterium]